MRASDSTGRVTAGNAMIPVGVALTVLSIPLGIELPVKGLSVASLLQVAAVLCLLPASRWFSRNDVLLLAALTVSLPVSFLPLTLITDHEPAWLQIIFFEICFVQLFLFIRASQHYPVRIISRLWVNIAAATAIVVGGYEFLFDRQGYLTLYFDDKSHAAVALTCLAFLVLWVNDSFISMPIAILLYFVSMATASRLVLFAMPFLAIAVLLAYAKSRRRARNALAVYGHHLLLFATPVLTLWLAATSLTDNLASRLSATDQAAAKSTLAHFELIRLAFEVKVSNISFLLFGMGPGGFADAVTTSGIDTNRLAAYDPASYRNVLLGWQPVHSATVSILTEFGIVVSISAIVLVVAIFSALIRRREWTMLLLLISVLIMTTFYSSHNEPFFTAVLCLVAACAFGVDATFPLRQGVEAPVSARDGSLRGRT
ncbi:hypothetical protein [Microbacterium kyungheense]|nr:hypothetical protein [Microbacterium kyungheense]